MDKKTLARFWSKVDKNGPVPPVCPERGPCWLWIGATNKGGYGVLCKLGPTGKWNRLELAHRILLEHLLKRELGDDECSCHHCDIPGCVNPDHLFKGSRADNLADMRRKGRGAPMPRRDMRGEKSPRAKLTASLVVEIRDKLASGVEQRELAGIYGVSEANISAIKSRRSWGHI
jgi:hypothetical protein